MPVPPQSSPRSSHLTLAPPPLPRHSRGHVGLAQQGIPYYAPRAGQQGLALASPARVDVGYSTSTLPPKTAPALPQGLTPSLLPTVVAQRMGLPLYAVWRLACLLNCPKGTALRWQREFTGFVRHARFTPAEANHLAEVHHLCQLGLSWPQVMTALGQ